ncbi:hypothetical protein CKO28_15840 [Rhodovibrio sodomensis]|uniref:Uncharacterized protein n=1 Tax=Rhodovibrio sodomensis TaxID=1088 RepID=A0ABS1DGB3_9PROT|nr:hypothetical protein [Rhodovibrio sodomensis]
MTEISISEALTPLTYPCDVARDGKDAAMPDVLREFAYCSRWSGASDPCGAHFPNLAGTDVGVTPDAEVTWTGM